MTRRPAALLLAGVAVAALLPLSPASAKCDDETHPCSTACDKVEAKYDEVIRKFGIPLPGFPLMCPQS